MTGSIIKVLSEDTGLIGFWCPGCLSTHQIQTKGNAPWEYNGNPDAPTFTPSVLITSGHYISTFKPGDDCWCTFEARFGYDPGFRCKRCHSFVKDGQIQFLADSSHEFAGQTVPLQPYPD